MNQALRDLIVLSLREIKEQGDMEHFDRWIDVVVHPRLEILLQLCIRHFDVAEQIREKVNVQLGNCTDALEAQMGLTEKR
jgi:hypothetical protein